MIASLTPCTLAGTFGAALQGVPGGGRWLCLFDFAALKSPQGH
jgi:hypothetical protein